MIKTGCWKDQSCYVIGGGTSLKGFDFDTLRNENTIAVNARIFDMPHASCFFSMDYRFYRWLHDGRLERTAPGSDFLGQWYAFKNPRLYLQTEPGKQTKTFANDVKVINCLGIDNLSFDLEGGLYSGGNSGLTAIFLAVALSANPIYLLGIDMYTDANGETHSYKCRYPTTQITKKYETYLKRFNLAVPLLEKYGIKIINVNDQRRCGLRCFPFGELTTYRDTDFVVVSYYTKNSEYEKDAARLVKSLQRHGVPYDVVGLDLPLNSRWDWKMATLKKAEFLLKMLDKYKGKSVVWVDADAEINTFPMLFDGLTCDVGVYYHLRLNGTPELLSGTIFFKNNNRVRTVLVKWAEMNKATQYQKMNKSDQINLQQILKNLDGDIDIKSLPESYTHVFDRQSVGNPVITHHQASRRYRHI
jgi:hypothetical protein